MCQSFIILIIMYLFHLSGLFRGKSFSQTTQPGDNVTFSCPYPEVHETDMKSVYKVTSQSIRAIIFTYTEHEKRDRYVLHVSPRDKVINMIIRDVIVDDGGLYLCGISKSASSYVSIFSEMQLRVTGKNLVLGDFVWKKKIKNQSCNLI